MLQYDVMLKERFDGEWLDEIVFQCSADDVDHALEQADDAYPDCLVMWVDLFEQ